MANRTVRVNLPISDADKFIMLIGAIIAKHEQDPATSKLDPTEVAELKTLLSVAKPYREEAAKLRKEAQAAQEQYTLALGIGKGQTSKTKGTCYNLVTRIRKRLLLEFEGNEEQLGTYGLQVVIGASKTRASKK